MKLLITYLLVSFSFLSSAQSYLDLNFRYQGENVYIQNPFANLRPGFCADSVFVNDSLIKVEINDSAFEIDLSNVGLEIGQLIYIKVFHQNDCLPKVLNTNWGRPRSTFEIEDISIDTNGILKWSTTNEQGKLTYIVEQYRWNKWIKVSEVVGKGLPTLNEYKDTIALHSGLNKIRVKQPNNFEKSRISKTIEVYSPMPDCFPKRISVTPGYKIEFEQETLYEVFDKDGNLIKKGWNKVIDCSNLKKGIYFLNYDNKTGEVFRIKRN